METIELSGIIGLIALSALVVNFTIGLALRLNYSIPKLPEPISLLQLHKITGYTAAVTIVLHIVLIPLDPTSGFSWTDLLLPAWTEHQPLANSFGSIAFYLLGVVVISSFYKDRIEFRWWRALHYGSYIAILPLILHSIMTDPKLQDRPIDWFDAEKIYVLLCCAAITLVFGYRFFRRKNNATRTKSTNQ